MDIYNILANSQGRVIFVSSRRSTNLKKYLTLKEVCEIFQLKESKLYRMSSQKRIPRLKIGNELRFDFEELKRFFSDNSIREALA